MQAPQRIKKVVFAADVTQGRRSRSHRQSGDLTPDDIRQINARNAERSEVRRARERELWAAADGDDDDGEPEPAPVPAPEPMPKPAPVPAPAAEDNGFTWSSLKKAVPDFVLERREPTGEEFALSEADAKIVREHFEKQIVDIYGTENGDKLLAVAKDFMRERRPNSAEIAPFYVQALYSNIRDIGPNFINQRITKEQFYGLVTKATAEATTKMVRDEEARRATATPAVQFVAATPVKEEPVDDDDDDDGGLIIEVDEDVPIDILYPRWARGRLQRPTHDEAAEKERAMEIMQRKALEIIALDRPDVSEDQMAIAHDEIWDNQDKLYQIPAMSAQIWKAIGMALRLKRANKEEFLAAVQQGVDHEWPHVLRYLADEAAKDDAELASGVDQLAAKKAELDQLAAQVAAKEVALKKAQEDSRAAIEKARQDKETELAKERQQAREVAIERGRQPDAAPLDRALAAAAQGLPPPAAAAQDKPPPLPPKIKPVRFSAESSGEAAGGGAGGVAARAPPGVVVFSGGNFGQRMAAMRAGEKEKAVAKARAYWAAHPRSEAPDKRKTSKMVYKADKYTPSKNDFPGVDTRAVGIKEGYATRKRR